MTKIIKQIIFIIFLLINFVNGKLSSRIVNGEMALIEKHPHQVSIRYPTIDHHLCGGTIIHKNLIITTSSCVSSDTRIFYSNIKILIGTNDGLDLHDSRIYEVNSIIYHENYEPRQFFINDIALLQLTKNIKYSPLIYPAFLPSQDQRKIVFWATGWGIDQELNNHSDGIYNSCRYLKKLELKWMTRGRCQAYYQQLHEHQMCSIGKSIASYITEGDAGSPVESYRKIVGIISLISINRNEPFIYTRVIPYVDWTLDIINKYP